MTAPQTTPQTTPPPVSAGDCHGREPETRLDDARDALYFLADVLSPEYESMGVDFGVAAQNGLVVILRHIIEDIEATTGTPAKRTTP